MPDNETRPNCDGCHWVTKPANCLFCRHCSKFACFVDANDDEAVKENEKIWKELMQQA